MSRFGEKLKKKSGMESEKLKKNEYRLRVLRRFSKFAHDVMPADCGLDFEGISSPQSPAITARSYRICNSVVGGQYR